MMTHTVCYAVLGTLFLGGCANMSEDQRGSATGAGNDAINEPLSVRRASAVRDYVSARGVAAQRLAIDGRGAREPLADNGMVGGRAANRRVEIYIAEAAAAPQ